VEEFADALADVDVVIQPTRTEQIVLRLRKEDLDALRAVARKKGVGHTTLARSIVEQWLARFRQKHSRRVPLGIVLPRNTGFRCHHRDKVQRSILLTQRAHPQRRPSSALIGRRRRLFHSLPRT